MNIIHVPYTVGLSVPFIDNEETNEKKEVCSICLDNDQFTYKSWVKLKCSHKFHRHCIDLWLEKKSYCPLCITIVDTERYELVIIEEEPHSDSWCQRSLKYFCALLLFSIIMTFFYFIIIHI